MQLDLIVDNVLYLNDGSGVYSLGLDYVSGTAPREAGTSLASFLRVADIILGWLIEAPLSAADRGRVGARGAGRLRHELLVRRRLPCQREQSQRS